MTKLFFHHVNPAPVDPIFGLTAAFNADPRADKINLSVGLYRDDRLLTPVLESVKEAEKFLLREEKTKEYLPISGDPIFVNEIGAVVFGDFFWTREKNRICGIQTLGGTGALRIGGDFLKQEVGEKISISDPTWPNHQGVFTRCGMEISHYPYYDLNRQTLEFDRAFAFLKKLTPGSIVVLQPCCHNPTGADFSHEEWKSLLSLFQKNGILPFFDFAYQGFGKNLDEDASPIRLFASEGMEMVVASSQSKNFGLYSERVGALYIVTESPETAEAVLSKLKVLCRTHYSNPPRHGASIVAHILSTPALAQKWEEEVRTMRERIEKFRHLFVDALPQNYRYLEKRTGMFCFTGLKRDQVERLQKEYGIYMTSDGRMNIAGLNEHNLPIVVEALTSI